MSMVFFGPYMVSSTITSVLLLNFEGLLTLSGGTKIPLLRDFVACSQIL